MSWYAVPRPLRSAILHVTHDLQPNLQPPIKTAEEALLYKAQLKAIDPAVEYLMTLYLSPELTPAEIKRAAVAGVIGEHRDLFQVSNS